MAESPKAPETPAEDFDRCLSEVENDPAWQARQERTRRVTTIPGRITQIPFGWIAIGLVVVAVVWAISTALSR